VDDEKRLPEWKSLSGAERYRVVELARKGETEIGDLCRTFGVSRQTLYRAMEAADRASVEALTPKRRGRKPKAASQKRLAAMEAAKARTEKELKRMSQRYEVAQALLDLLRKAERRERIAGGKKDRRGSRRPSPKSATSTGTTTRMAGGRDGGRAGSEPGGACAVDPAAGG
jgi:transposase-like protein